MGGIAGKATSRPVGVLWERVETNVVTRGGHVKRGLHCTARNTYVFFTLVYKVSLDEVADCQGRFSVSDIYVHETTQDVHMRE